MYRVALAATADPPDPRPPGDAGERRLRLLRLSAEAHALLVRAGARRALCDALCRTVSAAGLFSMTWIALANSDSPFERRQTCYCRRDSATAFSDGFRRGLDRMVRGGGRGPLVRNDLAAEPGRPVWLGEAIAAGHRALATLPLIGSDETPIGYLMVFAAAAWSFDGEAVAVLREIAASAAIALGRLPAGAGQISCAAGCADSHARMEALLDHLQSVREDERALIARELHDELGQLLSAMQLELRPLDAGLQRPAGAATERLERLRMLLGSAFDELHRVVTARRPRALEDRGLGAALQWLAGDFSRRTGIACRLDIAIAEAGLSEAIATTAFRCVQECLTNVMRHACARHVRIAAAQGDDTLTLCVSDDGRGLAAGAGRGERFGMVGLRQRAESLAGRIEVASEPDRGTRIQSMLPLFPPGRLALTGARPWPRRSATAAAMAAEARA